MTTLTGPANGEWVRVDNAGGRDVPARCDVCGSLVSKSWQWYVGLISHATVCDDCLPTNDSTTDPKEVTMEGITPTTLAEVALALEAAHLDWEEGRMTSPDSRDYVLITERVLTERIGPEYLWLSEATHESVAEALYERECNGELSEWPEMAEYLVGMVTVGPEGDR